MRVQSVPFSGSLEADSLTVVGILIIIRVTKGHVVSLKI